MASNTNAIDFFTLKCNIANLHVSKGYQFGLFFPALTSKPQRIERGQVLAELYSGCCARNVKIVSSMCHVLQAGKKGQTIECLNAPVESDWPPEASEAAANGTITLGTGAGNTTMTDPAVLTAAKEFDVGSPNDAALFRFEGEEYTHIARHFNGLPDGYVEQQQALQLDPAFEFFTAGGVNYDLGSLPATVENFWANFKYFFDYIVFNGVIVKKLDIGDAEITEDTNLWRIFDIDRVVFSRISSKKIGDPFGRSPGRHAA